MIDSHIHVLGFCLSVIANPMTGVFASFPGDVCELIGSTQNRAATKRDRLSHFEKIQSSMLSKRPSTPYPLATMSSRSIVPIPSRSVHFAPSSFPSHQPDESLRLRGGASSSFASSSYSPTSPTPAAASQYHTMKEEVVVEEEQGDPEEEDEATPSPPPSTVATTSNSVIRRLLHGDRWHKIGKRNLYVREHHRGGHLEYRLYLDITDGVQLDPWMFQSNDDRPMNPRPVKRQRR
jgi:hypothetical protein